MYTVYIYIYRTLRAYLDPSTHPDMRRVSGGQSAQTTTREVSYALLLIDTHLTLQPIQRRLSFANIKL